MKLPEAFLEMMRELLGDEYDAWLDEMTRPAKRGFRINRRKMSEDRFFELFSMERIPAPFADNIYYNETGHGLGNTIAYHGGVLYPQEPSAASAAASVEIRPGMKILDLCAAPGSKSTQIAELLGNDGLLVANDINRHRSMILAENLERCGCTNALVLNADHPDVADTFAECFDIVFCDAPCSGEGMFRKEEEAVRQWSVENTSFCAARQAEILESAYRCVKAGGLLVYSTCTLNMPENEENVAALIDEHPSLETIPPVKRRGRHGFALRHSTENAERIFPMDGGEGHFVCVMRKTDGGQGSLPDELTSSPLPAAASEFLSEQLAGQYPFYRTEGPEIFGSTYPFIETGRCRKIRQGVHLGTVKKDRFEPAHGMALSVFCSLKNTTELNEEEAYAYLAGMTVRKSLPKGWYTITYKGVPLGWVKADGQTLKNKYPKDARIRG